MKTLRRTDPLETADVGADVVRGLLLGAVLWSDKFLLFLTSRGHFAVTAIFIAMLPAVLAYNYYFVRLSPGVDSAVATMRHAMENEPYRRLAGRSTSLSTTIQSSILWTGLAGTLLAVAVSVTTAFTAGGSVRLVALVAVASWLFMMTTIVCYKLDFLGHRVAAQGFSAPHLLVSVVCFVSLHSDLTAYACVIAAESLVFAAALATCLTQWRTSEYALFWRHALAW